MAVELKYLLSAVGLYLVMILMQGLGGVLSKKASMKELLGPRDDMPTTGLSPFHARTKRAQANMTEGMMMFIPLVFAALYLKDLTTLTATGAAMFFYGRLAFAPLYYFGVPVVRTLAWAVSIIGLILIFVELLT
jgi:uncharacterized MAPEG superfamily protein